MPEDFIKPHKPKKEKQPKPPQNHLHNLKILGLINPPQVQQ